jgi:hypothetical protein
MKKYFALTVQMEYIHDLRKEEKFAARHHRREAGVMA